MNEAAASLAALNFSLLQAIKDQPPTSRRDLVARAGVVDNNLNRKLDSLIEHELIRRVGEATHEVELTADGERGLAAMAVWRGDASPYAADERGITWIAFDRIDAWDGNPRKHFDPASIEDMAQSVADKGVLQPITVRQTGDRFQVIMGERRRRGAALAVKEGWVSADFLVPCQVRNYSEDEALEVAGVENLQREDVHWMDLADYFRRMMDERRYSGPALERLYSRRISARKIQDYAKIARELPPETKAKAYLPDGDKDQLTYVKARDLVGEKKEKPALDLPPKLALAFGELIDAGLGQSQRLSAPIGSQIRTSFFKPPAGGPFHTLSQDRKLTEFRFQGPELVALTTVTEAIAAWLKGIGYDDDPAMALYKLRAAVIGELQAGTYASGAYCAEELNRPAPAPAPPPPAPAAEPPVGHDDEVNEDLYRDAVNLVLTDRNASVSYVQRSLQLGYNRAASFIERMEQEGLISTADHSGKREVIAPKPDEYDETQDGPEPPAAGEPGEVPSAPSPAPAADVFDLPPMLAIAAVEAAHKIATAGIEKGPGTWVAPIRDAYYRDSRVQQGVIKHKAWAVMPYNRDVSGLALTTRCLDWLVRTFDLVAVGDGRLVFDDELLQALQARLGVKPDGEGPYSTFWLNPIPKASLPPEPQAQAEAPAEPAATKTFSDHMREIGAEDRIRIIERLCGALREARHTVSASKTRKLNAVEVENVLKLIDSALEAAGQGEGA